MTKEKKAQRAKRASGSEHSSSRGASKRPTSSSQPPSQSSSKKASPARKSKTRKREDKNAQQRRKTEQAVRKASARASQRGSSQAKSTQAKSTQAKSTQAQSTQRKSSHQRTVASQKRTNNPSPQRNRNTSARSQGASVRRPQNSPQRKRPAQGASVRKAQPVQKRKPTAAEIRRRKRNRRLLLIVLALIVFLIAGLFTLYYVSHRIQDQTDAAIVDDSKSFAPVVCTSDILEASMKADAPVDENSPVTFTMTLHNTSQKNPCYIDVGRAHTEVTITSGDALITSLSTCKDAGKENKQLLIDRDMTTSFTLTWNRHRNKECLADAPIASPGMYKAAWATTGEDVVEAEAVFEIEKPPEPEPEPEESETPGEEPAEPAAEAPPANQ